MHTDTVEKEKKKKDFHKVCVQRRLLALGNLNVIVKCLSAFLFLLSLISSSTLLEAN